MRTLCGGNAMAVIARLNPVIRVGLLPGRGVMKDVQLA
jgi:hypothetical protein